MRPGGGALARLQLSEAVVVAGSMRILVAVKATLRGLHADVGMHDTCVCRAGASMTHCLIVPIKALMAR